MYRNNSRKFLPDRPRSRFARFAHKPQLDTSMFINKATAQNLEEYVPMHAFSDFPFGEQLLTNIGDRGYQTPTPIQDQAIPHLLTGKDVIGIANTGTGKTAAFLLPLIHRITTERSLHVLIIVPTRELAAQIDDEFRAFSRGLQLYSALCIGGVNINGQISALRRKPNFVIGTPGRLKDLERQRCLRFSDFTTIVLDEVDRMLDMGFIGDIRYIVTRLPARRHSLFFSATVPQTIRGLVDSFLTDPVTVAIQAQRASDHVNQDIIKANGKPKIEMLHDLLNQEGFDKVLLFGRTKWGIEKLLRDLLERGFKAAAIHGNKRQSQRAQALEAFKNNRIQILLATDIASRGIDVADVTHVINYDMPESYEDYIHRIGRTGRADKFGTALTFVD